MMAFRVFLQLMCMLLHLIPFEKVNTANGQALQVCFSHDECPDTQFCAWANCTDNVGNPYPCGLCQPCAQCTCDNYATDYQCPLSRCPQEPFKAVRFLQGEFYNSMNLTQVEGFACMRRFVVTGSMFSFIQLPTYIMHPANMAVLQESSLLTLYCPTYVLSGVLEPMPTKDYSSSDILNLRAIITSQGDHLSLP